MSSGVCALRPVLWIPIVLFFLLNNYSEKENPYCCNVFEFQPQSMTGRRRFTLSREYASQQFFLLPFSVVGGAPRQRAGTCVRSYLVSLHIIGDHKKTD